jgi:hypothetical protein
VFGTNVRAFQADWAQCDRIANYLATALTFDRPDPFLYANLLSTILNEALETIHWRHAGDGELRCSVHAEGGQMLVLFDFPADAGQCTFYARIGARIRAGEGSAAHAQALASDAPDTGGLGLYALVADYGCTIGVEEDGRAVRLALRVDLDAQLQELG